MFHFSLFSSDVHPTYTSTLSCPEAVNRNVYTCVKLKRKTFNVMLIVSHFGPQVSYLA